MTNRKPIVTVGMPVRNGEPYLSEAIESILNQSFGDFELIVSDNASTDATADICTSFAAHDARVRYRRNVHNLGASANYNLVFSQAKGRYFKWAAHDDLCKPQFIESCVDVLERRPDVTITCPRSLFIDAAGKIIRPGASSLSLDCATPARRFSTMVSNLIRSTDTYWSIFGLIRSDALCRTRMMGNYTGTDQVLFMHLVLLGRFVQIPDALFLRRSHSQASMERNRTPHERHRWHAPNNTQRILLPAWTALFERLRTVRAARIGHRQSLACSIQIGRLVMANWRKYGGELKRIPGMIRNGGQVDSIGIE